MKKRLAVFACLALAAGISLWYLTTQEVAGTPPFVTQELAVDDVLGLRDLVKESDLIVTGKCTALKSVWVENNRILVTLATIEVADTLKGSSAESVTVVLPGGADINRKFPVAMTYAGAPSIFQDEEVFLFLTAEDLVDGGFAVSGFNKGKFSLVTDENRDVTVMRDPVRGPATAERGGLSASTGLASLSDLTDQVRHYIAQ